MIKLSGYKQVYVLVPILVSVDEKTNRVGLVEQPSLNEINNYYLNDGGYDSLEKAIEALVKIPSNNC